MKLSYTLKLGTWDELQTPAQFVRSQVFVLEQKIPAELEWGVMDAQCRHVVAFDAQENAIGTGRLLPDGHIGRMAVLAPFRNAQIGAAMLRVLVQEATDRGLTVVQLNAQISAENFYLREGFTRVGEIFIEAGIEHIHMLKRCA